MDDAIQQPLSSNPLIFEQEIWDDIYTCHDDWPWYHATTPEGDAYLQVAAGTGHWCVWHHSVPAKADRRASAVASGVLTREAMLQHDCHIFQYTWYRIPAHQARAAIEWAKVRAELQL